MSHPDRHHSSLATSGRARYGTGRANAGERGEAVCGALLDRIAARRNDLVVLHDLDVPGFRNGQRANLDHVIVTATRIVAVDAKWWAPGTYWPLGTRVMRGIRSAPRWCVPAHGQALGRDRLTRWVDGFDVDVIGVIAVMSPGQVSVRLSHPDGLMFIAGGRDLSRWVRRHLPATGDPVDARLVARLNELSWARR
jgi:hypothetical protein